MGLFKTLGKVTGLDKVAKKLGVTKLFKKLGIDKLFKLGDSVFTNMVPGGNAASMLPDLLSGKNANALFSGEFNPGKLF